MQEEQSYLYQVLGGEAVLYRVYGAVSSVWIPERIGEYPVTAVGAYCFSDRNRVPEDVLAYPDVPEYLCDSRWSDRRELAGDYMERVVLPDSLRRIDNAAFFGCRKLAAIEMGSGPLTIGSDVFNNCSQLQSIRVRGSVTEPSGIRHIVSRISWEVEVEFPDAFLLYPEYYERYDTIAPAHIFGLNIEGEGFRARQCFRGDMIDFAAYDAIFGKACAEESVTTLGRMSPDRLMTPVSLSESSRLAYEAFVKAHAGEILCDCVKKRERERMEWLCRGLYADSQAVDAAIARAVQAGWSGGAASLLEWKHRFCADKKKSRYEF